MYESHFGFTAKPFQLNPDPNFFFGSRGHKRALAYLEYGLHQGEGFIVITGEVGAGKTTLVRGLLRRIHNDSIVPVQIVSTQVDSDDLLRLVASAFGLRAEGEDKATLLTRLEQYFQSLHTDGKRALLIVDEAQNLSPRAVEELRMLSNFQVGTRSLVQSFLVGQPEFRGIMQRPEMRQLKQRVIASYHLGPLDEEETQHYIEHRLRHVGWKENPQFETAAFGSIHGKTGGVPRRINTLCDRLLLAVYLAEKMTVTVDDAESVAKELAEELGGNSETLQPQTLAEIHALRLRPPSLPRTDSDQLKATQDIQLSSSDQTLNEQLDALKERVAILENSSNILISLTRRVLKLLRNRNEQSTTFISRQ
ncbi:MAG: XrtA-associated ATPase [Burkholderiales bacterium]|nr:XrtA-associated ATPase [Burkholderiales bacterium]